MNTLTIVTLATTSGTSGDVNEPRAHGDEVHLVVGSGVRR